MTRYDDNNPQHRKELHEYLTRPASKSKGAFRNFTKEQKTVNANELESLIKKTEKELSEDKIVTKTNNQKPKIDFLRKILLLVKSLNFTNFYKKKSLKSKKKQKN